MFYYDISYTFGINSSSSVLILFSQQHRSFLVKKIDLKIKEKFILCLLWANSNQPINQQIIQPFKKSNSLTDISCFSIILVGILIRHAWYKLIILAYLHLFLFKRSIKLKKSNKIEHLLHGRLNIKKNCNFIDQKGFGPNILVLDILQIYIWMPQILFD